MALLSKVQRGQPITAELFNNMIDAIRECQLNSVVGSGGTIATFKRGPGGTTISINSQNKQGQASIQSQVCPFTPTATASTGGFSVSFSVGTINGILPTNMFSAVTGVTTAQNNYFYLKCDTDGKLITTAKIEKDTSVRTPQASVADAAPALLNVMIAAMTTSGAIFSTIACENISARAVPSIQEDNVTYIAGDRNFKQYYNWIT
jgi:hypothetical protein